MVKRILLIAAFAGIVAATPARAVGSDDNVPLQVSVIDPTVEQGGQHKAPVRPPSVSLDGHILYFNTPCDGCELRLVDAVGVVVYSLIISEGTSVLELPDALAGEYELQIIRGRYCFWGIIEV